MRTVTNPDAAPLAAVTQPDRAQLDDPGLDPDRPEPHWPARMTAFHLVGRALRRVAHLCARYAR
jgi:hypothetical protein